MKISENLKLAKELLSDPARHCRGQLAMDGSGRSVFPTDEDAQSWCLMGAIEKVNPDYNEYPGTLKFANLYIFHTGGALITRFNDNTEHSVIMKTLDEIIKAAEVEGV